MKLSVLDVARIAHEANRALCRGLGDHSQPPFDEAPVWQVESATNGVAAIVDGVVTAPHQSHDSWSREKLENGWKYGLVKDPEAKTHPCLVPFEELPEEQQRKDHLFFAIVTAIAPLLAF